MIGIKLVDLLLWRVSTSQLRDSFSQKPIFIEKLLNILPICTKLNYTNMDNIR